MTDLPSRASVEPGLRDYLDAEMERAERDYPLLPRPALQPARRWLPAGIAMAIVAIVVAVVIGPRFIPSTSLGPSATPEPSPSEIAPQPALLVTLEGGRCTGASCSGMASLDASGRVVHLDGTEAVIPPGRLARIVESIANTNWDAVMAKRFEGDCLQAFDGAELIWTVQTPAGPLEIADCTIAVDYDTDPFLAFNEEFVVRPAIEAAIPRRSFPNGTVKILTAEFASFLTVTSCSSTGPSVANLQAGGSDAVLDLRASGEGVFTISGSTSMEGQVDEILVADDGSVTASGTITVPDFPELSGPFILIATPGSCS